MMLNVSKKHLEEWGEKLEVGLIAILAVTTLINYYCYYHITVDLVIRRTADLYMDTERKNSAWAWSDDIGPSGNNTHNAKARRQKAEQSTERPVYTEVNQKKSQGPASGGHESARRTYYQTASEPGSNGRAGHGRVAEKHHKSLASEDKIPDFTAQEQPAEYV